MTIGELFIGLKIEKCYGSFDIEIKGIAYDSRRVKEGFLFVAIKGFLTDGHKYIKDALKRGAVAVVVEHEVDLHPEITFIKVTDTRQALALLSSAFYNYPSQKLSLVGVTGTNGKTTTTYITKSILNSWDKKVGLLGTIQYIIADRVITASHTTPESLDLQRYLSDMVENGVEYVVFEVSSHSLALKRVEGCSFKVAVFTNFTQDHLDFHGTMDNYLKAKKKIFGYLTHDGSAVLNWDDPTVRSIAGELRCRVITYGFGDGAMLKAKDVKSNMSGLSFKVQTPDTEFSVTSPLVGRNNAYNILAAVSSAYALGVGEEAIVNGVREVKPIPGRFERVELGQGFLAVVDYAHTEDALRRLIEEARNITRGKVITVFGCGGDRDRDKRAKMGSAASQLSDFVIVTSDNPRTEEPEKIISEVTAGITKNNYAVLPDRAEAIRAAVEMARDGDTVLIAGKGHEDYQEIKGIRYPFSDREVLGATIKNLT